MAVDKSTSSCSSKRPRVEDESVCATLRNRSSDGLNTTEVEHRLLEGADTADPAAEDREERVSAKGIKGEVPVVVAAAAVVPPRGRGRPRKARSAAEVVAVAQEGGAKEKEQQLSENDAVLQQVGEREASQQQESGKAVAHAQVGDKGIMVPQESDEKVDGSAPENDGSSVELHVSADTVRASEPQDKSGDDRGGAVGVELDEEDDDDDDGGFDIKEGDEMIVLNKASGVEIKIGDGVADQEPDELRREEDKHLQPPQDQENQDPLDVESSATAKTTTRKSSLLDSNGSDNGSTASTNTQPNPSSTSKRRLEEQPDPELRAQQTQQNTNSKKKKQKTSAKISPASSRNLFQFTCKLLESQRLEYEVRARELEEKNAVVAAKRAKWEKKIRSVKRQLSGYGHPVDEVYDEANSGAANGSGSNRSSSSAGSDSRFRANSDWGMEPTSTALTTTSGGPAGVDGSSSGSSTSLITMRDAFSSRTSFPSGFGGPGGVDSLLPPGIQSIEAQIRDTLGSRAKLVNDMMKDLQSVRGLNGKVTRLR